MEKIIINFVALYVLFGLLFSIFMLKSSNKYEIKENVGVRGLVLMVLFWPILLLLYVAVIIVFLFLFWIDSFTDK